MKIKIKYNAIVNSKSSFEFITAFGKVLPHKVCFVHFTLMIFTEICKLCHLILLKLSKSYTWNVLGIGIYNWMESKLKKFNQRCLTDSGALLD